MNKRQKQIIGISAVVSVLLVLIIWVIWWLFRDQQPVGPTVNQLPVVEPQRLPVSDALPAGQGTVPAVAVNTPQTAAELRAIAMTFAERYGTYSTQSDISVREAVAGVVTPQFLSQIAEPAPETDSYMGVTTRSISATVTYFDDAAGKASINVVTQQQRSSGSTANPRPAYATLELSLVKLGGSWLVDTARWVE